MNGEAAPNTFVIDTLIHIYQLEKITLKIAAKIASVDRPLVYSTFVSI
jgi:hypothetical protein